MKMIVINGAAKSGKDQFVEYIQKHCAKQNIPVFNESTIDPVKNCLKILGWDGSKTDNNRKWMVDLKQLWIKHTNGIGPLLYIQQIIKNIKNMYGNDFNFIIFIHCREPEEIQKIVNTFENCKTLLIDSTRGKKLKNGSDDIVDNYEYDTTIYNNRDLHELEKSAKNYVNQI